MEWGVSVKHWQVRVEGGGGTFFITATNPYNIIHIPMLRELASRSGGWWGVRAGVFGVKPERAWLQTCTPKASLQEDREGWRVLSGNRQGVVA